MVGIVQDISAQKRAEEERSQLQEQIMQAQKMESVGRLAGGVAHDFNNMLAVIFISLELIKMKLSPADPLHEQLGEILHAATRARDITRQLLAFSRKQVIAPQILDLNIMIANAEKTLARLIGEDISLRFLPDQSLGKIKIDPSQIDQVLMNLAVNARDAMPDGGKLTIETAVVSPEEALRIAGDSNAHFDLLLTDVIMPGMNGMQMRDRIIALLPDIKVLFMSGYTSDAIVKRGVLDDGVNFIQKPFSVNALAAKLENILNPKE